MQGTILRRHCYSIRRHQAHNSILFITAIFLYKARQGEIDMLPDHISIFETKLRNRAIYGRKNDEHILNEKIEIHFIK